MFKRTVVKSSVWAMVLPMALVIALVLGRYGVLPEQNVAAASTVTTADQGSAIRIQQTVVEHEAGYLRLTSVASNGTAIGPHTILTHNHFSWPTGVSDERMTVETSDGHTLTLAKTDLILEPIDGGTMLIHLPAHINLKPAPVADRATVDRLGAGNWLTVTYWDGAAGQQTQANFQIVSIQNGVAKLSDPQLLINRGDSGGGAYFEGKLVGNTWSTDVDRNGHRLGTFNEALLPAAVTDLILATATHTASDTHTAFPEAVPARGGNY